MQFEGAEMTVRGVGGIAMAMLLAITLGLAGCASPVRTGSTSSAGGTQSNHAMRMPASGGDLVTVADLPMPQRTGDESELLVAENDLLEIDVFQVDELDKTVRVEPSGRISLPLIGAVEAAGKSITELETEIERLYGIRYLQNPEVSVFMKESAGQRITLDGEFTKPGIYASSSNTTLLQATALAGGLSMLADERKVYVFRETGNRKYVANYSIRDIREGRKPDPRIYGGDIVIAFQSGAKVASQNLREALGIAISATRLATPI